MYFNNFYACFRNSGVWKYVGRKLHDGKRYAALGVDTDKAIEILEKTPISLHCWQTDDVIGFESAAGLSRRPSGKAEKPARPAVRAVSLQHFPCLTVRGSGP